MASYTVFVSDHPGAGARIPTQEASESWKPWDYPVAGPGYEIRRFADCLANVYRHVRIFKGGEVGKLWYAVYSTRGEV